MRRALSASESNYNMLRILVFSSLLIFSGAFASHSHPKQSSRAPGTELDHNYLHGAADILASASASVAFGPPFSNHRDSYVSPSPFAKQHSHLSRSSAPHRRLRKDPTSNKLSSPDDKIDPTRGTNVAYILTANGKEKLYGGEGETKIAPHASPFVMSPFAKKYAYDKSFKKYRFAYANAFNNGNSPIIVGAIGPGGSGGSGVGSTLPPSSGVNDREAAGLGTVAPDVAGVSRTLNALHTVAPVATLPSAHHKFYTEKMEMYGSKGTMWKQLGPNVEISSSAEHVPFTRQITQPSPPKERKKSKASSQQRKNAPKNVRTGFMTSHQHALYVANNLKGLKGPASGAAFDHNTVLRHSDKFELTDAMISEAEKEEALKNAKALRLRFKQELPASHTSPLAAGVTYQSAEPFDDVPQSAPYVAPPFSFVAAHGVPLGLNAYASPVGSLGKGFVRHIEVEMNGGNGARKMVPALIIPLAPEMATANYLAGDSGSVPGSFYLTHPGSHTKAGFPYDIVSPRYVPHTSDTASPSASAESYHLQPFSQLHYQYKTQLGDESSYNPYVSPHYHNNNLYNTRFAFINSSGGGGGAAGLATVAPTNAASTSGGGTTVSTAAAVMAAHEGRPHRFSGSPHSHQMTKKPPTSQHMVAESSEQRPVTVPPPPAASISTYIYDADDANSVPERAFFAPSESTYFATISNVRDESRINRQSGTKNYEKSELRRD